MELLLEQMMSRRVATCTKASMALSVCSEVNILQGSDLRQDIQHARKAGNVPLPRLAPIPRVIQVVGPKSEDNRSGVVRSSADVANNFVLREYERVHDIPVETELLRIV